VPNEPFVALFRGINVGTAKRISMADLKSLFEDLGFEDVRTLLNSGNVVFRGKRINPARTTLAIEQAIQAKSGFSSRVTILSARELDAIVTANPMPDRTADASRYLVTILTDRAARHPLHALADGAWEPEACALGEGVAYLWCPNGQTGSPLAEAMAKQLGEGGTTRNWATILKIAALTRL
jgi:uncharacterized protein (DUF1697 family)